MLSGVNIVVSTISLPGPIVRAAVAADVAEYVFHINEDYKLHSDQMSGILPYLRHNKVGNAKPRYTLFTTRRALQLRQRSRTKPVRNASSKLPTWGTPDRASNKWQCHICLSGPYRYSYTPVCLGVLVNGTECNHAVCDQCKMDHMIPGSLA